MPALLGKDYYCHTCKKSYTQRDKHRCPLKCLSCFKTEHRAGDKITCDKCNRTFFGKNCFDEHLRDRSKGGERNVVCELVHKCTECHRTVGDLKKHVCGHATCSKCKSYCDPKTHKCYMLPVEAKGGACTRDTPRTGPKKNWCLCCKTKTTKYMFYDLETQQETGTHVVNYVNAQDFEGNEFTFDTIDEFCKFVFSKQHEGNTFITHNAKSFDAVFVLRYCIDNAIKRFCIYNWTKIMYMAVEKYNVRFVDSINFVNAALGTFPNIWVFGTEKRLFSAFVQHAREPSVRRFNPTKILLRSRSYEA